MARDYCVYIMANEFRTIYTGFTGDLTVRVQEHKQEALRGFTKRYHVHKLVYYESFGDPWSGIAREKQIKGWLRCKKIALIESQNPDWKDLAADWYGTPADLSEPEDPS